MSKSGFINKIFKNTKQKQLEDLLHRWEEQHVQLADDVKKMNRWSRRQSHFLESMHQELSAKLDATYKKMTDPVPYEALSEFAQNFSLYCLSQNDQHSTLTKLWSNFQSMLKALDMELILDLHAPFDDSKHQTCDIRHDPGHPEGVILEVVRPGLLIQGKLHTQALVVVNKAPQHTRAGQHQSPFE